MRKKLIALAFALAAVAASTISSPASAAPRRCPEGTGPIDCGHRTICCPYNAICVC